MVLIAGVDEAGRGCVIGPLVVAGVLFEESNIDTLQEMDVREVEHHLPAKFLR